MDHAAPVAAGVKGLSAQARDRVVDLIEARFAGPVSLHELADAAGLGVRQFFARVSRGHGTFAAPVPPAPACRTRETVRRRE
jgi:transcriptional regulator GlxA family with amidase domain